MSSLSREAESVAGADAVGPVPSSGEVVLVDAGDDLLTAVAEMGAVVVQGVDAGSAGVGRGHVGEAIGLRRGKHAFKRGEHVHGDDVGIGIGDAGKHGVPGVHLASRAVGHARTAAPVVQLGDKDPPVVVRGACRDQSADACLVVCGRVGQVVGAARATNVVVAEIHHREIAIGNGCAAQSRVDLLIKSPHLSRAGPRPAQGVVLVLGHQAPGLQLLGPVDGARVSP